MKKNQVLHGLSIVIILGLLFAGYSYRSTIAELGVEIDHKNEVINEIEFKVMELEASIEDISKENEGIVEELANTKKELEYKKEIDRHSSINDTFLRDSYWRSREILLKQSDILSKYDTSNCFIIYGSDSNAEYVIRHFYVLYDNNDSVLDQLSLIAENLSMYKFGGYPIEVLGIEEVDGKKIANIDIREPEGIEDGWSINFFMGSSGGIITAETLIESFLQRETDTENWVDGVHFSYEGVRDWITDHDPSLCRYTYYRNGERVEDDSN